MRGDYMKGNQKSHSTQTIVMQNNVSKLKAKLETRDLVKEEIQVPTMKLHK